MASRVSHNSAIAVPAPTWGSQHQAFCVPKRQWQAECLIIRPLLYQLRHGGLNIEPFVSQNGNGRAECLIIRPFLYQLRHGGLNIEPFVSQNDNGKQSVS